MPSAKHNLIMDIAMGLISSLFEVASVRDVPFHQPSMYITCIMDFPLSPVPFVDSARCSFICNSALVASC